MPEITSRPYHPEAACEACVFGRGEHAGWCEQSQYGDHTPEEIEWIRASIKNAIMSGESRETPRVRIFRELEQQFPGRKARRDKTYHQQLLKALESIGRHTEPVGVGLLIGQHDATRNDYLARKNAIYTEAALLTAQRLSITVPIND